MFNGIVIKLNTSGITVTNVLLGGSWVYDRFIIAEGLMHTVSPMHATYPARNLCKTRSV
jgi:hypothetical protein